MTSPPGSHVGFCWGGWHRDRLGLVGRQGGEIDAGRPGGEVKGAPGDRAQRGWAAAMPCSMASLGTEERSVHRTGVNIVMIDFHVYLKFPGVFLFGFLPSHDCGDPGDCGDPCLP
jgi:hypothetical protein